MGILSASLGVTQELPTRSTIDEQNLKTSAALPAFLTPEKVSQILGLPTATLTNWRYRGTPHLPYTRVGRRVLYLTSGLVEFLAKNMAAPAAEEG